MIALEAQLAKLQDMALPALRVRWIEVAASAVPQVSPALLRLAIAWELQAQAADAVSSKRSRGIDQLAQTPLRSEPSQPQRLTREWRGRIYVVTVDENVIRWDGREWNSLSEVAREITGTRWSGPAFFGLKKKVAA
ncbi:DUF2924 domain-containing protein [Sphingomonas sp. Y38-1Y]|uniref:DUF2924 domain-containing protein n=1 Tax=Sphingomonas sp. Y38-1Y TaxID=3078265 RepID=UPI0028E53D3C|nr:DUF2924 domain-containing protein [Sphingomonas sp. Y38-1Y]